MRAAALAAETRAAGSAGSLGLASAIGAGCKRYLAYGVFNLDNNAADVAGRKCLLPGGILETDGSLAPVDAAAIAEDVAHSRYTDECAAPPTEGRTIPEPEKDGAYSWLKAPRYGGAPAEVGPLARGMVAFAGGDDVFKPEIEAALSAAGAGPEVLPSVLGRHLARALECQIVTRAMMDWLQELVPGDPVAAPLRIPQEGEGAGLTEGPRGALGHWIQIKNKVIDRYQLVVPTTWNGSPRDKEGTPGPIEQAIEGTEIKDADNPFEIVRIVRSFDPCLACSVHVMDARGTVRGVHRIV